MYTYTQCGQGLNKWVKSGARNDGTQLLRIAFDPRRRSR